jgi:hypothetical protein
MSGSSWRTPNALKLGQTAPRIRACIQVFTRDPQLVVTMRSCVRIGLQQPGRESGSPRASRNFSTRTSLAKRVAASGP